MTCLVNREHIIEVLYASFSRWRTQFEKYWSRLTAQRIEIVKQQKEQSISYQPNQKLSNGPGRSVERLPQNNYKPITGHRNLLHLTWVSPRLQNFTCLFFMSLKLCLSHEGNYELLRTGCFGEYLDLWLREYLELYLGEYVDMRRLKWRARRVKTNA
jgi:hypothetical protein